MPRREAEASQREAGAAAQPRQVPACPCVCMCMGTVGEGVECACAGHVLAVGLARGRHRATVCLGCRPFGDSSCS